MDVARKSRDVCQENRWRVTFRGKVIIIRDLAEKILSWVDKFKAIGDIIMQYDPSHAALPWAGVRLLLQVSSQSYSEYLLISVSA